MHTTLAAACAAAFVVLTPVAMAADQALAQLPDAMPQPLAREVAAKAIDLVEREGLYPRRQAEYDQAKAALLAAAGTDAAQVDRKMLYQRTNALLRTLDADGHSFLIPAAQSSQQGQQQFAGMQADALRPPSLRLVTTSRGMVLRWTPPAFVGAFASANPYIKAFYDEADARPDIKSACALVVDLSEQTGGNAWPPFAAMYPLFSAANTARMVDRDNVRTPVFKPTDLEAMAAPGAAGRANPLAPYAAAPLAVVVDSRTSSAGEMLLVALLGEARVRTFGQTSQGMSTANRVHPLADGSLLVLTGKRYAIGEGPVYRGGIPAMQPAEQGAPVDDAVKTAAEWAAANSPACAAGGRAL